MRVFSIIALYLFFFKGLLCQNVGIGTNSPNELFHIQNGHFKLEGFDKYIKLFGSAPGSSGIQFYSNRLLKSVIYYDPIDQHLNFAKDLTGNGLVFDPVNSKLFFGRNFSIGDEVFGLRANTTQYGGMYIETTGLKGYPFYGYATEGAPRMWHFYDGQEGSWKINIGGTNKFILQQDGKLLVGRESLIGDEVFSLRANTTQFGGMYMETSDVNGFPFYGYATGDNTRMLHYYDNPNNSWNVRFDSSDKLTLKSTGQLGVGIANPLTKLHTSGTIRIDFPAPTLQFYNQTDYLAYIQQDGTNLAISNLINSPINFKVNNLTKMTLHETGYLGIATVAPISPLHIYGNLWDLSATDGVMSLGSSSERMSFGIAIDGAGKGTGRIYSKGTNTRLVLGGGVNDVMSILGNDKRVGIGTNNPSNTLDVLSEESTAVNISQNHSGSLSKFALEVSAESTGTGSRTGILSSAFGNAGLTLGTVAGRFIANGNGGSGNVFGLNVSVSSSGTGNKYGIYTTANTTNPGPGTRSWALYAQGNSYFDNINVGTLDGAAGYKISVDGKIISEELKVKLSSNWPDYVFEEDYELMTIEDLENYINTNKHLPGVPSADKINADQGFEVGEMNKILLEKIEELTLLLIEQKKKIDDLERKFDSIHK